MKQSKKRYSVPAKLVELMFVDDTFFDEVFRIKKTLADKRFPRIDQWASESGFNMHFALAGYSIEDLSVIVFSNTIEIKSDGLEDEKYTPPSPPPDGDAFDNYSKDANEKIYVGYVSRGIARRGFNLKYIISEEFDVSKTEVYMVDGLLHIFVPNYLLKDLNEPKCISIKNERKK